MESTAASAIFPVTAFEGINSRKYLADQKILIKLRTLKAAIRTQDQELSAAISQTLAGLYGKLLLFPAQAFLLIAGLA